ncbi:hypothetical protein [Candidatus Mycoplasma haematohominis]|uniref:Uncharacterized protein n=1 Tax=Candidatus Mycoplasma haematohominis TaxID=1494318 RepID=A0A478FTQ9_9MOLU|nr:hypothetical protein [Candidatus Mycoplasma haemohominis]GCE63819.1 hypothetical protein MHSWG343_08260 [Candidatus Mycoplasma haemohominis]
MDFLNLLNVEIGEGIDSGSYNWSAYFTRFIVIFWFFVFPCIFGGLFLFLKEINKNKNVVFVFSNCKNFWMHSYVFHNFLFCFLFGAFIFNIFFFLYTFVDTYLLELDHLYEWFWDVKSPKAHSVEDQKFFWAVVFVGFFLHTCVFFSYTYYNLYKTDSFFGETWRLFIKKNLQTNERLKKFRLKHPYWYDKIYPKFLDVKVVNKGKKDRSVIVIDN